MQDKKILSIVDANINRLKEGLRVVEDILRFYYRDRILFRNIRNIRHSTSGLVKKLWNLDCLISARDSAGDEGRKADILEMKRKDIKDILGANLQRAKESLRVLEEFAKLKNRQKSYSFKKQRFAIYELERKIFQKV